MQSSDGGSTAIVNPMVVVDQASKQYAVTDSKSRDAGAVRRKKHVRYVESLKPTSFVAEQGESVGVLGRNGSGKSTFLKLLAGSEPPTRGRILVKSQPMLLGVSPALQPYLTGRQNVILGCMALGMSKAEAEALEPEISEWADIGDAVDRPLKTFSSGQGARLGFAISTAVKPEILLVDEALSTGDAAFAAKARERMETLLEGAGCLFLVSHSMNQVTENCRRSIWIDRGRIIADGPSEEVSSMYAEWTALLKKGSGGTFLESVASKYQAPKIELATELETRGCN